MAATEPGWERVEGWGLSTAGVSRVLRPQSVEDVQAAFALARDRGWSVGLRGNGRSYGDAAQNDGQLLLDFTAWNRVQSFDPVTGVARLDPGLTLEGLWTHLIPHGWWPKVVSGTMSTTIGGVAAMNIHGKNAYKVGTWGNHVRSFDLVAPDGAVLPCSRRENADVFHAAIGGFGALGVICNVELDNIGVGSGRLMEYPYDCRGIDSLFERFEELVDEGADYCVGWMDAFAGGRQFGRGQIHTARYLSEDEDPLGMSMRDPAAQRLPDRLFGVVPKGLLWRFARPFGNALGFRMVNLAKVVAGRHMPGADKPYHQTHGGFHFLLDYVPNWKLVHGPGGLIQFQPFVPADAGKQVIGKLLRMQQDAGLVNWLTVLKRHKPDPFLMTHGLDGWSLAQDFNITNRNRQKVWELCHAMTEVVLDAGGRFYPAKDATLTASQYQRSLGQGAVGEFRAMKKRLDPDAVLQSNLYRRLMTEL